MSFASNAESHAWWAALRHEGLLLDESRLRELFPDAPFPLNAWRSAPLRKALITFQATPEDAAARTGLIIHLLEQVIGLDQNCGGVWQRGNAVPVDLAHRSVTGENIKPQHLWTHEGSPPLPVFISPDSRLGVGHGRRTAARVIEWMRAKQHRLALLTNGHQWRLLYAHGDSSAWCESDSSQWFIEGNPAPQLDALRLLLDPRVLLAEKPDPDKPISPLLSAIEASRRGQSELSAILGERVRVAVEKLIVSHGPAFLVMPDAPPRQDIYVAACRIVLRLVFTLFAEARDLLPRSNPIYWHSYSLGGLLEQLLRLGAGSGRERLRHRFSAWPRLLALGRLVHAGSPHEALPLLPYGGELFAPGDAASADGISRALAVFESACFESAHQIMPDSEVLEMLTLITRTQTVIRQGRGRATVTVPVDFSDLSSEYIGILYEGLLDYELRCVSEDEAAVLFLAIGHEPALPLARLEQMKDDDLKGLVDAFKKAAKATAGEGEEDSDDEAPAEDESTAEDPLDLSDVSESSGISADDEPTTEDGAPFSDTHHSSFREAARSRAIEWAKKAVVAGGLVPRPRRRAAASDDYEHRLTATARRFISRLILPGEWYLVRWGGTRKGSGSFYTRPGLALPTIRRTLEPLAYKRGESGALMPRQPQAILALKTCDPSCGSGTFSVGALRYFTEALFQSVFHHGWLVFADERQSDGTVLPVIKPGPAARESVSQPADSARPAVLESLLKEVRLRAIDDESRLRAWLKRLVVENCLYGVDLDPLAIELARLALWVETMDPSLPFTFLDHKFRCGNGLVGAWLDTFQHYPVMAWHREGGDKNHANFHHHFREKSGKKGTSQVGDVWTEALKTHLDNVIRPSLRSYIEETTQTVFALLSAVYEPNQLLDQALTAFADIHAQVDDPAAQRVAFQRWLASPHYLNLRTALDLWCALWFWPADRLAAAPTPQTFAQPGEEALAITAELQRSHRFFHWELEFPDVFGSGTREVPGGFHAILGNPPWETIQPMSKEFFSNKDPLYRTYGKQVALSRQTEMFAADIAVEHEWLGYIAHIKAISHFTKYAAYAFGDPADHANKLFHFSFGSARQNTELHARWRPQRKSLAAFADPAHPFRHQGEGKTYLQKLFTEQAHAILRPGGRLGFILPSGIYSDKGSAALRRLFLDHCRWEWCFGFENREGIFDIHRSFKFVALLLQKGGTTAAVRTAFMRRAVDDWDSAAEALALDYPRDLVTKLSPFSTALVEIRDPRDVAILDRMYSRGVLLGDQSERGWGLKFQQGDFNMTSDSKLFPPLPKWEAQGYRPDEYGHWLKGDWQPISSFDTLHSSLPTLPPHERAATITTRPGLLLSRDGTQAIRIEDIEDVAVPLYEGRMIGQFDFSQKGWVSGKGRTAVWRDIPWSEKQIEPQYLMRLNSFFEDRLETYLSIIEEREDAETAQRERRRLSNVGEFCNWWKRFDRKAGFMDVSSATNARTLISSVVRDLPCGHKVPYLSSARRFGLSATLDSLSYDFVLRLRMSGLSVAWFILEETFLPLPSNLSPIVDRFSRQLTATTEGFASTWLEGDQNRTSPWQTQWALSIAERTRVSAIVDALVAWSYGFSPDEFRWIAEGCDHPRNDANSNDFTSRLDPKGFWRVDKEKDPELRHTVLAQVAYADLCAQGLDAFLTGPDGDGWQLPATLRLADYGLGHDDRARAPQPVASRLGPRFLDWQLQKDPAQSWAECAAHATQLEALWFHARSLAGVTKDKELNVTDQQPAEITARSSPKRAESTPAGQVEFQF